MVFHRDASIPFEQVAFVDAFVGVADIDDFGRLCLDTAYPIFPNGTDIDGCGDCTAPTLCNFVVGQDPGPLRRRVTRIHRDVHVGHHATAQVVVDRVEVDRVV